MFRFNWRNDQKQKYLEIKAVFHEAQMCGRGEKYKKARFHVLILFWATKQMTNLNKKGFWKGDDDSDLDMLNMKWLIGYTGLKSGREKWAQILANNGI